MRVMPQISFITANFAGRALNYAGPQDWASNDAATVRTIDGPGFSAMAAEIADAGFDAIDIWHAHCHYQFHADSDYLEVVKGVCSAYDFRITSYAGGLYPTAHPDLDAPFRFMKQLGAPILAGGIFNHPNPQELLPQIQAICERYDVRYAFENHPETSIDEIVARSGGGKFSRIGVCLDTGWCARQGFDALEAAQKLRPQLLAVHLKDVTARDGDNTTCALGEGIVPVEQVARFLTRDGFDGPIAIEHGPRDHDPMEEIRRSLGRVQEWVR